MVPSRSSTSSSDGLVRRLPWAGIAAALLVVALDTFALGDDGVWRALRRRIHATESGYFIAGHRRAVRILGARDRAAKPLVLALGNSRVQAGIHPERLMEDLDGVMVVKIARPGIAAFQLRALVEEVRHLEPAAVILFASEFETHRPVRLEPVIPRGVAGFAALRDLALATSPAFLWENRDSLFRLVLATLVDGYRYRDVLGEAGGYAWRQFPFEERFARAPGPIRARHGRIALWEGSPRPVEEDLRAQVRARFPELGDTFVAIDQVDMVREVTRGAHVGVQMALLRSTVEALHADGIPVVLVEAPLHPLAAKMYDPSVRSEFTTFVRELATDYDVRFVSLDDMGPFGEADFGDLIHLRGDGVIRLTRSLTPALAAALSQEKVNRPPAGP